MTQNLVNTTLGKYQLLDRIGRGGMAEVYRARQSALKRDVAIKVMHSHLTDTDDLVARFKREATAVARLRHPNIVQIFDFDFDGDINYIVMEYIDGPTLKAVQVERQAEQRPFALAEINDIFLPLVSAVSYAHEQGIIHRDLKPANIMFTLAGQVILTDFGIARLTDDTQFTQSGVMPGTPGYMSPEQGQGQPADERSDIYALGVILYELLTGRLPFDGQTPIAMMMKSLTEPIPSPRSFNPNLSDSLERVMLKALDRDQTSRFQSTHDLSEALQQALATQDSEIGQTQLLTKAELEPGLNITCFQSFDVKLTGQPSAEFRSVKGRALLAYLAIERDHAHPRATLAGLLWPDEADKKARRNLNQTLFEVRQSIEDDEAEPPYLTATHQTLAFNLESDHWVDVTAFEAHLAFVQTHNHADLHTCATCMKRLELAATLYAGPFLDGFYVQESDLFETWILTKREQLKVQVLEALTILSHFHERQSDYQQAQTFARRWLELEPWEESAHRQLMRILALSGQRSAALAQFEICRQILDKELGVEPADETVALYEQIRSGDLGRGVAERGSSGVAEPPLKPHTSTSLHPYTPIPSLPTPPAPFQAIAPPTHFVGRETEIVTLKAGLSQPGLTIYALVGMGGVGKTTLSTAVAEQARDDFPDGVLWANTAASNPMDILASWAQIYDYDFNSLADLESRAAAVRSMFTDKQTLLIIDNVNTVSEVKPLLPNGSNCAVLLTTRDLDVAYGLNAEAIMLGELSPENGQQLLIEILGADRVVAERDAAQEICDLLQNLPLAVEIVAQRLKSRPRLRLSQMAIRLRDETHRLGLKISDQAVRTSFTVSWESLDDALQQIFSLLAVFDGRPFAAEAIAAIAEMDVFDVEDHLAALVALSLLQEDGDTRYRQHALLADFASETLSQPDEAYRRLSAYYLTFAQDNHENALALQPEWENLVAAIDATYRIKQWALLVSFTNLLAEPWIAQLRYDDARYAYKLVQEAAPRISDKEMLATNLLRWGRICLKQNDLDEAEQHFTACLTLFRDLADTVALATVQCRLANIALERNHFDDAKELLLESLTLRVADNDMVGVGEVLYNQAYLYFDLGEYDNAQQVATEALDLLEAPEQLLQYMQMLRLLAHIFLAKGQFDEALSFCERALASNEKLETENELAQTLYTYSTVLNYQQKYDMALTHAEKSLALAQRQGLRRTEGQLHYQLSLIYTGQNHKDQAIDCALQSIRIFEELQDNLSHAYALLHLGRLYLQLNKPDAAADAWRSVQTIGETLQHTHLLDLLQAYRQRYATA